ncbi:MAG: efflux RND transporter periplasmic adaptor subunit [Chloroflexi bacterium]|nr:efflux RND transporter periplasmic adaptor subunit [Chloroflexota bacterium]
MNRKWLFIILGVVVLVAAVFFWLRQAGLRQQATLFDSLTTEPISRGELVASIEADGVVRSEQSAELVWSIAGEVAEVLRQVGDEVKVGDVLAVLDETSLPQNIILAQADLIAAQQALDDLLNTQTQQAQALKVIQDAEDALEDAHNPAMVQAQAQAIIAVAERQLESIQLQYDILMTPPSQSSIQQVYDNILLTQEMIKDLEDQVADLEKTLQRAVFHPFESLIAYKQAYASASAELARQQARLLNLQYRYEELHLPPDLSDVATAEAALAAAQAQLADAQRQWARVKDGATPGEIAVLEAQLADAQREYERVKDGPTADDIAAAEARVAAAQAIIGKSQLRTPIDGVITQVEIRPGDQVNNGTLAFRIDKLAHLLVDVQVSELDINRTVIGQSVLLTFDAIFAAEYHGVVMAISPVGNIEAGLVSFDVTIEVVDPDAAVRPGMSTTAKIEVSRVADALLVPNAALRTLDGQRVVYVFGGDTSLEDTGNLTGPAPSIPGAQPVPITIGQSSGTYSEIVAGDLKENDLVVLNPPSEWLLNP